MKKNIKLLVVAALVSGAAVADCFAAAAPVLLSENPAPVGITIV